MQTTKVGTLLQVNSVTHTGSASNQVGDVVTFYVYVKDLTYAGYVNVDAIIAFADGSTVEATPTGALGTQWHQMLPGGEWAFEKTFTMGPAATSGSSVATATIHTYSFDGTNSVLDGTYTDTFNYDAGSVIPFKYSSASAAYASAGLATLTLTVTNTGTVPIIATISGSDTPIIQAGTSYVFTKSSMPYTLSGALTYVGFSLTARNATTSAALGTSTGTATVTGIPVGGGSGSTLDINSIITPMITIMMMSMMMKMISGMGNSFNTTSTKVPYAATGYSPVSTVPGYKLVKM